MPVTFTFHKLNEKKPEHNQAIVFLKPGTAFDSTYFFPLYCTVEYCWEVLDEDGEYSGSSIVYHEGDDQPENSVLGILFGDVTAEENSLWMDEDDYWEALSSAMGGGLMMSTPAERDKCRKCSMADKSVNYSSWHYCTNKNNFREFTIIRHFSDMGGSFTPSDKPSWCPY